MTEKPTEVRSLRYLAGRRLPQDLLNQVRVRLQRLLRKREAPRRLLSIEEQIAVGPKKSLMLVNCAGRRFLFVTAGDSITPGVEVRPVTRIPVIGYIGEER